jgi:hypothetical protein
MNFLQRAETDYDFSWFRLWSKIGFFSAVESLIRNVVYLIVILRSMNLLEEQVSYIFRPRR